MGFWIFGNKPQLTVKYQTEYIFAKKTLAQWRKFRPTSSVTGMAHSYSIKRYEGAVHAQAQDYHLAGWGSSCSCGLEVGRADEDKAKDPKAVSIFSAKGHIDYWSQAYTYLFIGAETVRVRESYAYEPFNYKWYCQLCGHKEQALKDSDGKWIRPQHEGFHSSTLDRIFEKVLAQRDFRNRLAELFESQGLVSDNNRYVPDED